jgi:ABC-type multidrug transport system fused ATPase/permease subunit
LKYFSSISPTDPPPDLVTPPRLNIRIRNKLFAAVVGQEIGFFDTTKTGEVTSRLTSDATTMSDSVGRNLNIFLVGSSGWSSEVKAQSLHLVGGCLPYGLTAGRQD